MAKRGKPQAVAKKQTLQKIADVIMYAVFHGDQAAMDKFGLARRTIQRYRKRSLKEPELAQIVAYRLDQLEGASLPDEIEATISEALQAVRKAASNLDGSPESLTAFAGLLQIVMGYDLNRKLLHARLGISKGVQQG